MALISCYDHRLFDYIICEFKTAQARIQIRMRLDAAVVVFDDLGQGRKPAIVHEGGAYSNVAQ